MSPSLFNVVKDNFIRTCLAMRVEDQMVPRDGLIETIGRCVGFFYADNGMVGSIGSYRLQHAMNILVGLFRRYGLADNIEKSLTMTCQPRSLRAEM